MVHPAGRFEVARPPRAAVPGTAALLFSIRAGLRRPNRGLAGWTCAGVLRLPWLGSILGDFGASATTAANGSNARLRVPLSKPPKNSPRISWPFLSFLREASH